MPRLIKSWTVVRLRNYVQQMFGKLFHVDTANGRVGVGTDTPQGLSDGSLHIHSSDTDANDAGQLTLSHYEPTMDDGDNLGEIWFAATEDNITFDYGAWIVAEADGEWTIGSDIPTRLKFGTVIDGATTVNTRMTIKNDGAVGIGEADPISKLDVAGKIAITSEVATPSAPDDGKGWLYTKTDGKLYWQSYDVAETDLTSGGGVTSYINTVHYYYASQAALYYIPFVGTSEGTTISNPGDYDLWMSAPFNGKLSSATILCSYASGTPPGSTDIGVHASASGTPSETQTIDISSWDAGVTATFSDSNHFMQGDKVSLSVDPTNVPRYVVVTCIWQVVTG